MVISFFPPLCSLSGVCFTSQIHCFISSQKFLNTCAHHHIHPHTCTPSNSDTRAHTLTCACIHTLSYMFTHTCACTHEQILTTHTQTPKGEGPETPSKVLSNFDYQIRMALCLKISFLDDGQQKFSETQNSRLTCTV